MSEVLLFIIILILLLRRPCVREDKPSTFTLHSVQSDGTITVLFKDKRCHNG